MATYDWSLEAHMIGHAALPLHDLDVLEPVGTSIATQDVCIAEKLICFE